MTRGVYKIRNRHMAFDVFLVVWVLSIYARGQTNYDFRGISNSTEEFDAAFPINKDFSGQVDVQMQTQGKYADQSLNPFKYVQRIHVRPWLYYNGFKNTQIGFSTSYLHKFDVPATGLRHSDEIRVTFLGTLTQPQVAASVYEQFRVEIRNVRDASGTWKTYPRFRLRFGQNFDIERNEKKRRLLIYEEVAFKVRDREKAIDSARFFIGHLWRLSPALSLTAGFLAQASLKSNGSDVDIYFGPKIQLKYTFGKNKPRKEPPDPDINQ